MLQRQAILDELRVLLTENLELEAPDPLLESHRLYNDLQVDSIMSLQLLVYIEEAFGVSVPEDGLESDIFLTVGSLADFVEKLQKAEV